MRTIIFAFFAMLIASATAVAQDLRLVKPQSPPIAMKEAAEFGDLWTKAAARMPDDSKEWKEIQKLLRATTGSTPATKVDEFKCLYDFVRGAEEKRGQLAGAQALMAHGGPLVVRECLLHPNPDIIGAACDELVKTKPKKTDKGSVAGGQPKEKDSQAVPFLVYVLQRNNFAQQGSEESTIHFIIKRNLVDALLYITDTENLTAPVDVDEEKDVDRVLAIARKWMAEKGLQPLEKQRPPKAEPPTDSKPAPAPTVPPGAKSVSPTDQPAPNP